MIKALREETQAPIAEVKAALTEAGGDLEAARSVLRKKVRFRVKFELRAEASTTQPHPRKTGSDDTSHQRLLLRLQLLIKPHSPCSIYPEPEAAGLIANCAFPIAISTYPACLLRRRASLQLRKRPAEHQHKVLSPSLWMEMAPQPSPSSIRRRTSLHAMTSSGASRRPPPVPLSLSAARPSHIYHPMTLLAPPQAAPAPPSATKSAVWLLPSARTSSSAARLASPDRDECTRTFTTRRIPGVAWAAWPRWLRSTARTRVLPPSWGQRLPCTR